MNRHLAIITVISGLAFSAGCGDDKSTESNTAAESNTPTTVAVAADRTIAGTITYEGDLGSGVILVVANLVGNDGPPLYSVAVDAAGPFAITGVDDGEYIIFAFVDAANDRGGPEDDEAQGFYDTNGDGTGDSVFIAGGVGVIDIDIALV